MGCWSLNPGQLCAKQALRPRYYGSPSKEGGRLIPVALHQLLESLNWVPLLELCWVSREVGHGINIVSLRKQGFYLLLPQSVLTNRGAYVVSGLSLLWEMINPD